MMKIVIIIQHKAVSYTHLDVYKRQDHKELARILKEIRGRFILSYNNDPYIKELYKGLYIEEIERNNNLSNKNCKYKELIIKNY